MAELIRFGVSIPEDLIKHFDESIKRKGYNTRSEAIRDMMRDYLVNCEWEDEDTQVAGTITIVYDHHVKEISKILNGMQHNHHRAILCSTHVHLDDNNCLEAITVRGTVREVRDIADHLISTKGVKHGKLVCTTTGKQIM